MCLNWELHEIKSCWTVSVHLPNNDDYYYIPGCGASVSTSCPWWGLVQVQHDMFPLVIGWYERASWRRETHLPARSEAKKFSIVWKVIIVIWVLLFRGPSEVPWRVLILMPVWNIFSMTFHSCSGLLLCSVSIDHWWIKRNQHSHLSYLST